MVPSAMAQLSADDARGESRLQRHGERHLVVHAQLRGGAALDDGAAERDRGGVVRPLGRERLEDRGEDAQVGRVGALLAGTQHVDRARGGPRVARVSAAVDTLAGHGSGGGVGVGAPELGVHLDRQAGGRAGGIGRRQVGRGAVRLVADGRGRARIGRHLAVEGVQPDTGRQVQHVDGEGRRLHQVDQRREAPLARDGRVVGVGGGRGRGDQSAQQGDGGSRHGDTGRTDHAFLLGMGAATWRR